MRLKIKDILLVFVNNVYWLKENAKVGLGDWNYQLKPNGYNPTVSSVVLSLWESTFLIAQFNGILIF